MESQRPGLKDIDFKIHEISSFLVKCYCSSSVATQEGKFVHILQ